MRGNPRPRWQPSGLGVDTTTDLGTGRIGLARAKLDASQGIRERIQVRVAGDRGPGLILRLIPEKERPSARVHPADDAILRDAAGVTDPRAGVQLEVAAPTWWTTLRSLPGPSTTLAVATLVTALLVAAPLVLGTPADPARSAAAAVVEVDRIEDDLAALPGLTDRLQGAVRELPDGPARTDARRTVRELETRAGQLTEWERALAERASRAAGTNPWDVAAKLAALVTAVLSFVVAYRALRPGG